MFNLGQATTNNGIINNKISVIMPTYNVAPFVEEAAYSILNQTYKNLELIVVDDCSTDGTYEKLQKIAKKDERVILCRNDVNSKICKSLNKALNYATGAYIARMDGDDISLPTRFEKEIQFLDNHPEYALVSCPMIYYDESGEWATGKAKEKPMKEDFRFGTPFCHAPSMIRTSALKKVNGYTATKFTERIEDYYLWYKLYKAGFMGYNLQEPLYKMRNDKNAFSRRKFNDRIRNARLRIIVAKGLNLRWPYTVAIPDILKAFVPISFVHWIKHHLYK